MNYFFIAQSFSNQVLILLKTIWRRNPNFAGVHAMTVTPSLSLQCSKTIDWEMAYKLPFYRTKATKLIIFQFKLLHRRLATNDFLNKIGIRENDICTFCRTEEESLFHLFWSCSETSSFWRDFTKWLAKNQRKLKSEILTPGIIIGVRSDTLHNKKQYFYFLVARFYIWSCRIKEVLPKIDIFPSFLSFLVPSDS